MVKFTTNAEHEHHYNEEYFHTTLPHSTKKAVSFHKETAPHISTIKNL